MLWPARSSVSPGAVCFSLRDRSSMRERRTESVGSRGRSCKLDRHTTSVVSRGLKPAAQGRPSSVHKRWVTTRQSDPSSAQLGRLRATTERTGVSAYARASQTVFATSDRWADRSLTRTCFLQHWEPLGRRDSLEPDSPESNSHQAFSLGRFTEYIVGFHSGHTRSDPSGRSPNCTVIELITETEEGRSYG